MRAQRADIARKTHAGMVVLTCLPLMVAVSMFGLMGIVFGNHPGDPETMQGLLIAVYDNLAGLLPADSAVGLAGLAVGVCAAINVALAVGFPGPDLREQAEILVARERLDQASSLMAGVAVMAVLAGLPARGRQGQPSVAATVAFSALLATVAVLLAATARRQSNAADRASRYRDVTDRLKALDAWCNALMEPWTVPLPLGRLDDSNKVALHRTAVRGCAWRLLWLVALVWACLALVLMCTAGAHRWRGSWWQQAGLFAIAGYMAMSIGIVIGLLALQRWTASGPNIRTRLSLRPKMITTATGIVVLLWLEAAWVRGGVFEALVLGAMSLLPMTICWAVLWLTRTRGRFNKRLWIAARPFWELVDWTLQNAWITELRLRDQIEADESRARRGFVERTIGEAN
ncbi:hypothetical protein [Mycolicibacter sinensis]|nr:hypothetical protein [Mycolicibacter sinensis]